MENTNKITKEEILSHIRFFSKGRVYHLDSFLNEEELVGNIQMLMEKGLTYDDAEKVVHCKVMARFATESMELNFQPITTEDYADESVHPFIEELFSSMVAFEADLNTVADNFCGEVFGDAARSPFIDNEEEVGEKKSADSASA